METVHEGVIDMDKVLTYTLTFRLKDGRAIKAKFTPEDLEQFRKTLPSLDWIQVASDQSSSPEEGFVINCHSIVLIEIKED